MIALVDLPYYIFRYIFQALTYPHHHLELTLRQLQSTMISHLTQILCLFFLISNLIASITAIKIHASKGATQGPSGFQICNLKSSIQQWGCLPSHQCDSTQEHNSVTCEDEGKPSCREMAVGSADHHIMYSGNSFDCLDISGTLDEVIQLYSDGKCQNKMGENFTASDAQYLLGTTAYCIEISKSMWALG